MRDVVYKPDPKHPTVAQAKALLRRFRYRFPGIDAAWTQNRIAPVVCVDSQGVARTSL